MYVVSCSFSFMDGFQNKGSTMKVVLLAGGLGTRLSEETTLKPKPMVEIGSKPILWHIMKIFSSYGHNEFIICCGYKGYVIKEYFQNYFLHMADVTFDMEHNTMSVHQKNAEPWKVTLVDTGLETMTGGRLKRVKEYIGNETFMMTYGDGVADIDINELVEFHKSHGKLATLTAAQPEGRFGILGISDDMTVHTFAEKSESTNHWVNAGFFVLQPDVIDYIDGDSTMFERAPLETLAAEGNLKSYKHHKFWFPMDKKSDRDHLDKLWDSNSAPWKVW